MPLETMIQCKMALPTGTLPLGDSILIVNYVTGGGRLVDCKLLQVRHTDMRRHILPIDRVDDDLEYSERDLWPAVKRYFDNVNAIIEPKGVAPE